MAEMAAFFRLTARIMVVAMVAASIPHGVAHAGMVTTDRVIDQAAAQHDRVRVLEFLERDDVRRQLEALGVDPDEAAARVDGLSNAEVTQIAGQIEELPAGQSAAGAIIGAAVLILVVLLVTDLLGVTNVYSFVQPI